VGTFRTTRGLHNKSSLGCGASGAYALGPDEKKKKKVEYVHTSQIDL